MKKLKKFIKPMLMLALVIGAVFAINGCAKQTDDDGTQTVTEATETDATVTDAGDTDDKTDTAKTKSKTVKADAAKTGKTENDSDKKPSTQAPATTEAPTTQAPAPTTEAPTTQAPRTEEPTTAHQHTWKTVVDKDEWDEPIYEEQDVYENHSRWPDGTLADELRDSCAKQRWCADHCVSCFPNCPDPDPAGRCALRILYGTEWVGTEKVQTGTKHHDAVTHQECSVCGARK
ncbi:hypothetical protein [Eubacterium sp. MSJ-33]|uniref:hypothetical protein n=1 Tax=Eubacterium sp. MSJ-33 TaxID=2841528 RepID=UPI001C75EC4C|nr:hypothetical protein [Eubacterium sp. MSJ-33]QWT54447.1 hypothetical protein KP625_01290 [Eubacterium sp. MSJ-33]